MAIVDHKNRFLIIGNKGYEMFHKPVFKYKDMHPSAWKNIVSGTKLDLILSRCYTDTSLYIPQLVVNISQLLIHKIALSTLLCHHSNSSNKHPCF